MAEAAAKEGTAASMAPPVKAAMGARAATVKTAPTPATLAKAAVTAEKEAVVPRMDLGRLRQTLGAGLFSAARVARFSYRPLAIS